MDIARTVEVSIVAGRRHSNQRGVSLSRAATDLCPSATLTGTRLSLESPKDDRPPGFDTAFYEMPDDCYLIRTYMTYMSIDTPLLRLQRISSSISLSYKTGWVPLRLASLVIHDPLTPRVNKVFPTWRGYLCIKSS